MTEAWLTVTLPDAWVVAGLGVAFSALALAIRTLWATVQAKDLALERKGERTSATIDRLTTALEALTLELKGRQ